MAKKEDFEVNLNDYDTNSNELEIIELWDSLPDYCKTPKTLEKIKSLASQTLLDKLTKRELLGNCD